MKLYLHAVWLKSGCTYKCNTLCARRTCNLYHTKYGTCTTVYDTSVLFSHVVPVDLHNFSLKSSMGSCSVPSPDYAPAYLVRSYLECCQRSLWIVRINYEWSLFYSSILDDLITWAIFCAESTQALCWKPVSWAHPPLQEVSFSFKREGRI